MTLGIAVLPEGLDYLGIVFDKDFEPLENAWLMPRVVYFPNYIIT